MSTTTPATEIADFVARTRFEDLPGPVVAKAKRHILDTLGAALAGATSVEGRTTRTTFLDSDGPGRSLAWGSNDRLSPRNAAFVNGTAAHAFELDDTGGCDHSGAVVLPAVLAALDLARQPITGRDMITAVVLGYDIGRRVMEGFGGYKPHNQAGWHSTGTCGTFGAAAGAAAVLGLDRLQTAHALTLSASFSSGLWAFIHDGAMAKRLHAGRAAEGGLLAAQLARAGMTGPVRVFDDVWGGFFATFGAGKPSDAAFVRDLGVDWKILIAAIKPYASCRDTHSAVDAVGRLLVRGDFTANDVASVRIRANAFLAGMVGGRDASTLPAAQMSLPYAVAVRICLGQAGLSAYALQHRTSAPVRDMIGRIELVVDPTVVASDQSTVSITLKSGATLDEPTAIPLGSPTNPVSDAALIAKFEELAGLVIDAPGVTRIANAVLDLDRLDDARPLVALLASSR